MVRSFAVAVVSRVEEVPPSVALLFCLTPLPCLTRRSAACHRTFVAHYEHVLADPAAYIEPLTSFLELGPAEREALKRRLSKRGRMPARKAHKLTQYAECKDAGLGEQACYHHVSRLLDTFFLDRGFMWPTFASSGFDFAAT